MTIYLVRLLLAVSSGQPGKSQTLYTPLLGLAPNGVYLSRPVTWFAGELLPRHFTLTGNRRYVSVALFRTITRPGRYPAFCLEELGLSSCAKPHRQPSDLLNP